LDAFARALPSSAPPAGYFESLPGRVRARLEARRPAWRLPVWSLAAAAALALVVLTPAVLRRNLERAAPEAPPAAAASVPAPDTLALKEEATKRRSQGVPAAPPATWAVPPPAAPVGPRAKAAAPERAAGKKETAPQATEAPAPRATPAPPAAVAAAPPESFEADEMARQDAPAELRKVVRDRPATRRSEVPESEGRLGAGAAAIQTRARPTPADARYAWLLAGGPLQDADAARAVREAWRAFVRDYPSHAGADEARVRALEAGAQAYRLGHDARDLDDLRADAAAYLARADAAQPERVRTLLAQLND
jgi:hypothetical protein